MADLLTPKEAAKLIDYKPSTLGTSRATGKLNGVAAPAHIKRGFYVFYERSVILAWKKKNPNKSSHSANRTSFSKKYKKLDVSDLPESPLLRAWVQPITS